MSQDFQFLSKSVVVPVEVFNLLAACYWGGGPRYKGLIDIPTIQDEEDGETETIALKPAPRPKEKVDIKDLDIEPLYSTGYPVRKGFVPRGYAATLLTKNQNLDGDIPVKEDNLWDHLEESKL